MQFHIGAWVYRLRISAEPLVDSAGTELAARWDWERQELLLSGSLPPQRRLKALLHEHAHAWRHELGVPADEEGACNSDSARSAQFWRDLLRQGGEPALLRLNADGVVDHSAGEWEVPVEPRTPTCPVCGGCLSLPVRNAQPVFDLRLGRLTLQRQADCEFCGHTVCWTEGATCAGVPNGQVLGTAQIRRGAACSN